MQSTVTTVDDYLAEVPQGRREILTRLRDECRIRLSGHAEGMYYGMPGYARDDVVEVAFASQKQYISVYILKAEVLDAHRDRLGAASVGKGCIRYRRPEAIDLEVIGSLLDATHNSRAPIC
ncbi:MAG: DUF1801 domain-containing protein [Nostocoides sp.]|uniref:iron chaperone n=1 Tax=Nostocoides sp. TaxID=1917966 RepID=UPI003BCE4988